MECKYMYVSLGQWEVKKGKKDVMTRVVKNITLLMPLSSICFGIFYFSNLKEDPHSCKFSVCPFSTGKYWTAFLCYHVLCGRCSLLDDLLHLKSAKVSFLVGLLQTQVKWQPLWKSRGNNWRQHLSASPLPWELFKQVFSLFQYFCTCNQVHMLSLM